MGRVAYNLDPEDLTFYPDHDDMGESALQRLMTELLRPLLARFLAEQGVRAFVGADQFIYYVKGNPKCVVAPDVYVLPGVDPAVAPRCWKVWEEGGIVPSFALEIMSEVDDLKDVAHAPERHNELGTKELLVFDPYVEVAPGRRTRFRVHRRDAKGNLVLKESTNEDRVLSRVLGCYVRSVGKGAAMRVRLGTGNGGQDLVPTDAERAERAEQMEQENARLRAELEALRKGR